jgi:hypothetical protein
MNPLTIADAHEMVVPDCFSEEFAYYERHGLPLPCGGPVFLAYHPDPEYDDPTPPEPVPCQGPPPAIAFLGLPIPPHPHEAWCYDPECSGPECSGPCPPPF